MSLEILYGILFFVGGVCIGSFSNVLIYRLPKNESINFPASHCQSCLTPLKWFHNIPLFSWIFLRGKCAFCGEKISIQYPLVEFFCGILAIICYLLEPNIFKAIFIALTFILLFDLSIIDFRYTAVPDALLYPVLVTSFIYSLIPDFNFSGIINAAFFAGIFWLLRLIVSFALKREAMGSGDIFIAGVIGAVLSWKLSLVAIYFAAIFTLPAYLIVRKKNYELPFVPFLAFGLFITWIFDLQILEILKKIYG